MEKIFLDFFLARLFTKSNSHIRFYFNFESIWMRDKLPSVLNISGFVRDPWHVLRGLNRHIGIRCLSKHFIFIYLFIENAICLLNFLDNPGSRSDNQPFFDLNIIQLSKSVCGIQPVAANNNQKIRIHFNSHSRQIPYPQWPLFTFPIIESLKKAAYAHIGTRFDT